MFNLILKIISKSKLKKFNCKITSDITKLPKRTKVTCESNVKVGGKVIISGDLIIGAFSYIRSNSEIYGSVSIGRYCSIANGVIIGLDKNQHPTSWLTTSLFCEKFGKEYQNQNHQKVTKISHDCWIGRDAIIMAGVEIGTGAIVAARAVVTKNVPAYSIVMGTPAKVIKYRFEDHLIEELLHSAWWNINPNKLQELNISKPQECLSKLELSHQAVYQKLEISRDGVKILDFQT